MSNLTLDYINIKYSHKTLHPRPIHVKTTLEIQKFIQNNIRKIKENETYHNFISKNIEIKLNQKYKKIIKNLQYNIFKIISN